MGAGDHRYAQRLGEALADRRDCRATADSGDRRQVRRWNPVALQRIPECIEKSGERLSDQPVQLRTGQPDVGPEPGQLSRHHGDGLGGQPLLGQPALFAQPGQRTHCGGTTRVAVPGPLGGGQDMIEHRLVDPVSGELPVAHRLPDRGERGAGVGQGDRGSGAAEVAQRHHPVAGQSGRNLQCGQCGGRVGDDGRRQTSCRQGVPQRTAQGADGGRSPVRRDGHHHPGRGPSLVGGAGQRLQCRGQQYLRAMCRTVRRDQWNRVAHPFHETAKYQAGLSQVGAGEFRILGGDADLCRSVIPDRQDRTPAHRRTAGPGRHQVRRPDRQSQCVAHGHHDNGRVFGCPAIP